MSDLHGGWIKLILTICVEEGLFTCSLSWPNLAKNFQHNSSLPKSPVTARRRRYMEGLRTYIRLNTVDASSRRRDFDFTENNEEKRTRQVFSHKARLDQTWNSLQLLAREALVWHQLKHPHVLRFAGLWKEQGVEPNSPEILHLVSPWMDKGTIMAFIKSFEYDAKRDRARLVSADPIRK